MAPPITIIFEGAQWRRSAGNDLVAEARRDAASIADGRGQRIVGTDYTQSRDEGDDTYSITFDAA